VKIKLNVINIVINMLYISLLFRSKEVEILFWLLHVINFTLYKFCRYLILYLIWIRASL